MWDFSIGSTLAILLRTWPFILMRIVVYFGITAAYVAVTGTGAGVGYGVGHVFAGPDGPGAAAIWGGVIAFGLVSAGVYWIREYILYIVKAGHIAVMVHLIDGRPVPYGQGQIAYARKVVADRFMEANALFMLDQLVKGAVAAINGIVTGVTSILPGLQVLAQFVTTVVRLSLTYVDEVVLGYNIRVDSRDPFTTARRGVVLYAQNAGAMIRNAIWLAVFLWGLSAIVFVLMLAPAASLFYWMPGALAGWSFVFAVLFAWALKSAILEPFAIAALMSVYFRRIEGQVPDPAWDARLAELSRPFRELGEKAFGPTGRAA